MATTGNAGFNASLSIHHESPSRGIDAIHDAPPEVKIWLKTLGHDAETFLDRVFNTNLSAKHFRPDPSGDHVGHFADAGPAPNAPHVIVNDPELHGVSHVLLAEHDLGSGLVTNAGVNLMGLDFSTSSAALKLMNFHQLGTGATAAAVTDIVVQTAVAAASLTGSTNGFMAGTQSYILPASSSPKYQTVSTFTANASIAATEFVLAMANFLPINVVATGTTYTATGAGFTAVSLPTVGSTISNAATAVNTPTTTAMGIVTASTTTSVTVPGFVTQANATVATPTNATASQIVPTIWDRKVFAAINLVSADTLSLTYQVAVVSGG